MTKWEAGIAAILAGTVVALVASGFEPNYHHRRNSDELVRVADEIRLTVSAAEVRSIYARAQPQHLTLREVTPDTMVIETPFEFGAQNWNLLIDLQHDQVTQLRIRKADSLNDHPEGAPPDRVGTPKSQNQAEPGVS